MTKHTATPNLNHPKASRRYLLANRTEAVLYRENTQGEFVFVHRMKNSSGRKHEGELVSDRAGRTISSAGGGSIHHGLERRQGPHEHSAEKFVLRIAQFLGEGKALEGVNELVIVAEPHFLGLLRESFPKSLSAITKIEVNKEYKRGSDEELRDLIRNEVSRAS